MKEIDDIVATAQFIEESGNRIKAIQNISKLQNISLQEAETIVNWFVNNKAINIVFH
jgi:hypothetical protein